MIYNRNLYFFILPTKLVYFFVSDYFLQRKYHLSNNFLLKIILFR
jgi:hypothetical protein